MLVTTFAVTLTDSVTRFPFMDEPGLPSPCIADRICFILLEGFFVYQKFLLFPDDFMNSGGWIEPKKSLFYKVLTMVEHAPSRYPSSSPAYARRSFPGHVEASFGYNIESLSK